ncbi:MAG: hypothetical protein RBS68_02785 [Anaerolineales bacterium]|jgi:hypothetical protein|nr:hypothetical protein [Anaerolineales bacterium]
MLNIEKILKRSWHILWNYRTLWIFGFILALAAGGGGASGNSNYSSRQDGNNHSEQVYSPLNPENWQGNTPAEKMSDGFAKMGEAIAQLRADYPVEFQMGIAVAITLFVTGLLFGLVITVLRYLSETATIRMVDEYEQTGLKVGFRQGWKYGWSRISWRLFFIDLIVHLPALFMFVLLMLVTWWIISAALAGVEAALITSLVAGIGLLFLFGFIIFFVMLVLYVVRDFAWRISILENKAVLESLRLAGALIWRNWKNVGLMWLVVVAFNIAWTIIFFVLLFPLLAISMITALGGLLVATLPTLATAGIASLLSAPGYWPWAFALIIGGPLFFLIAFSPILLVSGWALLYQSNLWTLTYRELKAIETVSPTPILTE